MTRTESLAAQGSQPTSVQIIEQWGETPIFAGPSWRISWPLSSKDYRRVASAVTSGSLWEASKKCFPSLSAINALSANPDLSRRNNNQTRNSTHLWAIKELAQALLGPSPIEICHPRLKIGLQRDYLVLRSVQHELLGSTIAIAAHLIKGALMEMDAALPTHARHSLRQALAELLQKTRTCCTHQLTMAQLGEAYRRKIPAFLLDPRLRLYQLGSGSHSRWISSTSNDRDSSFGVLLAKDKIKSGEILRKLGMPTPREMHLPKDSSAQQLALAAEKLGFPCVMKPQDAEQGRGVTANIKNNEELMAAASKARKYTNNQLVVQEHVWGCDHRLNIVNGNLTFVIKRSAPTIVGNGKDTVLELIDSENARRRRLRKEDGISAEIDIEDKEIQHNIASAGATPATILQVNQIIQLRENANISTGGLREELNIATVHPKVRKRCEAIAVSLRLDTCGVDYITPDITADPEQCKGAFIEINSMPQNSPQRIPLIFDSLFPPNTEHSIKTTTIISNWKVDELKALKTRLENEFKKRPSATISFHRELSARLLPLLSSMPGDIIQIHNHPREPLLNKKNKSIIYLTTPEIVLQKGLAPSQHNELINWCSEADLRPAEAWRAFADSLEANKQ